MIDLARNLAAIFAFDLACNLAVIFALKAIFADSVILAILWYFDLSLNHDQLHIWSFCFQDTTLNHFSAALAVL